MSFRKKTLLMWSREEPNIDKRSTGAKQHLLTRHTQGG